MAGPEPKTPQAPPAKPPSYAPKEWERWFPSKAPAAVTAAPGTPAAPVAIPAPEAAPEAPTVPAGAPQGPRAAARPQAHKAAAPPGLPPGAVPAEALAFAREGAPEGAAALRLTEPGTDESALGRRAVQQEVAERTRQAAKVIQELKRRPEAIAKTAAALRSRPVVASAKPSRVEVELLERGVPLGVEGTVSPAGRPEPTPEDVLRAHEKKLAVAPGTLLEAAREAGIPVYRQAEEGLKGVVPKVTEPPVRRPLAEIDPDDLDVPELVEAYRQVVQDTERAAWQRRPHPEGATFPAALERHAQARGMAPAQLTAAMNQAGFDDAALRREVAKGTPTEDIVSDPRLGGRAGYRVLPHGTFAGSLGTDIADVPEVARPGEPGFERALGIIHRMQQLVPQKRLFEMEDLYLGDPEGLRRYVTAVTDDILKAEGGAQDEAQRRKAIDKTYAYLASRKTVGDLAAPIFLHLDADPLADPTFGRAIKPSLEVIGVDDEGTPIVRRESRLLYVSNLADVAQAAVTGALFGPNGLPGSVAEAEGSKATRYLTGLTWDAARRGAVEGIAQRDMLLFPAMKLARERFAEGVEEGKEGKPVRPMTGAAEGLSYLTAGLVGTVLFPDALLGAGGVVTLVRRVKQAAVGTRRARAAGRLLVEIEEGRRNASAWGQVAEKLRAKGLGEDALNAEREEASQLRRAQSAEAALREPEHDLAPVVHEVDRVDRDIAVRIAEEHPDITDPRLARSLRAAPEEPPLHYSQHPSLQRVEMEARRAGEEASKVGVGPSFDTAGQLEWLRALREKLEADPEAGVNVWRAEVKSTVEEIGKTALGLDDAALSAVLAKSPVPPGAPPAAKVLAEMMDGAEAAVRAGTPEAAAAWIEAAKARRADVPGIAKRADDAEDVARFKTARRRDFITRLVLPLGAAVERAPHPAKVERALRAVRVHNETRAAAAALVWKSVDETYGTGVRLSRREKPAGEEMPSLSAFVRREVAARLAEAEPEGAGTRLARAARAFATGEAVEPPAGFDILDFLVVGARTQGMRVTREELTAQLKQEGRIALAKKLTRKNRAIRDAGPKRLRDRLLGKSSWTAAELSEAQEILDAERAFAREPPALRQALSAEQEAIRETSASTWLQNWVEGPGKPGILKAALATILGGNADRALLQLPPTTRRMAKHAQRLIYQGYADALRLLNEIRTPGKEENEKVLRYLAGADTEFRDGSVVASSGYDMAGAVRDRLRAWHAGLNDKDRAALAALTKGPTPGTVGARPREVEIEAARVLFSAGAPKFLARMPEMVSQRLLSATLNPPDVRVMQALARFATSEEEGLDSLAALRRLHEEVARAYGDNEATRVLSALAGHGQLERAIAGWTLDGLAVRAADMELFKRWAAGEWVPPDKLTAVKALASRFGLSPDWVEEMAPLHTAPDALYVPAKVQGRMIAALTSVEGEQAVDRKIDLLLKSDAALHRVGGALLRFIKNRMIIGNVFLRQRYFWTNTLDHFDQLAIAAGYGVAAASVSRIAAQNVITLPFLGRAVWAAEAGGRLAAAGLEAGAGVAGVNPARVAAISAYLRDEKHLERMRKMLQAGGDAAAQRVGRLLGAAKYRVEVNAILEGRPGSVVLGGKVYTYEALRRMAVEHGVFGTFPTTDIEPVLGRIVRDVDGQIARVRGPGRGLLSYGWEAVGRPAFDEVTRLPREIATAWAERERVGAFATLLEAGLDADAAGKVTVQTLFDYVGSMTRMDRLFLLQLLFPFWAYTKNANRLILDGIFSPRAAYRIGQLRRVRQYGPTALSAMMYDFAVEPYGVDIDHLPPEARDTYWRIREEVEDFYGGYGNVPEDVRRAVAGLLAGDSVYRQHGRVMHLDQALRDMQDGVALLTRKGAVREFDPATRRSWLRARSGIVITPAMTEALMDWYTQAEETGAHPVMEVILPESTIQSAMRHASAMAATAIQLAVRVDASTFDVLDTKKAAGSYAATLAPLLDVADPYRAPLLGELVGAIAEHGERRVRVHPALVKMIESDTSTVLPVGAAALSLGAVAPGREFQRTPGLFDPQAPETAGPVRDPGYFLPPTWSIPFENSPLGELNRLLFELDATPLEEKAGVRGRIVTWARRTTGVQIVESDAARTARAERPREVVETTGPPRVP